MMARVPQHGFSPVVPDGVRYHWVDAEQAAQTDENCDNARLMPFITGSEPERRIECDGNVGGQIRSWFKGLFQ
jgi:penicillin-binding protein 1B